MARRALRWLPAATVLAAAPKCVLCLAAYAGLGALGAKWLGRPEICGATAGAVDDPRAWFVIVGAAAGFIGVRGLAVRRLHSSRVAE